jgi:RNA-directed DNA polymerase
MDSTGANGFCGRLCQGWLRIFQFRRFKTFQFLIFEKSSRIVDNAKGTRHWVFSTETNQLKLLSNKKIVRHIKLTLDVNPYLNKGYFAERKYNQGLRKLSGKFKKVWDNQEGIFPICNFPIDVSTDAEERPLHHINRNHKDNRISNLAYLHVHCHRQIPCI